MQNTHNTGDCRKYEKDGTPKKAFTGKSMQRTLCSNNAMRSNNTTHVHNSAYVQLSMKIMKLEKQTGSKSMPARSASMIKKVIAKNPTHPEVMGTVVLGNP